MPLQDETQTIRPLLAMCALGLGLRLAFLLLTGDLELQADEANYVYLAISWNHFGFYSDTGRFLWPPAYPWLLAQAIELFGIGGIFALKLVQVIGSASVGMSTMLFARRLFGQRAALVAGALWCLYLPLIGFTHLLWNETLFLAFLIPAMLQVLIVLQAGERARDHHLLIGGVLFAGALYIKEMPLFYAPVLALLLAVFGSQWSFREGMRRGSLFLITVAVCLLPWTLRNVEVYGRFVPVGASLGENVFGGLNAPYKNFDIVPFFRRQGVRAPVDIPYRKAFSKPPAEASWLRADEIANIPDRLAENTRRGLAFSARNQLWFLRSRVQKVGDLAAPTSFFLRHMALGMYDDCELGRPGLRQTLVAWVVLCPIMLLLLGAPAFWLVLGDRAGRWLIGSFALYVLASSLLVSMSRFRLPIMPFIIVLAAGLLDGARARADADGLGLASRKGRRIMALTTIAGLAFLWWLTWPQCEAIVRLAWSERS